MLFLALLVLQRVGPAAPQLAHPSAGFAPPPPPPQWGSDRYDVADVSRTVDELSHRAESLLRGSGGGGSAQAAAIEADALLARVIELSPAHLGATNLRAVSV